ncbi:site-specific DNA recombinase; e14 prophage (modular protein) [Legionella lansingensis]|uniref:Uncharacterized protein n=1 Tax=Legionella lansingensis TaxID=45067 RepID=A0A0W0VEL7_9GAMM|nr:hypothetical protein [Legionella lansingensis]KTD18574.1 hypothetical protein Llan_2492 [Legionella lansingensis]SNV49364.1 site-specific DNA recombinase; e14 prophage (modular protein) [Legionella lansingensis]
MVKKDKDGWEYILKIPYQDENEPEQTIYALMQEAESIADCRNGFTEMSVVEPATGKSW